MTKARDIASAAPAPAGVTSTELGYVDGVTSALQTQINSKIGQTTAINPTIVDAKGDIIAATAADTVARLAVGANNTVLTADSSTATGLKWATPATTASGLTLIKTQTIGSAVSAVTVTDAFSATYDNYLIIISGGSGSVAGGTTNFTLGSTTSGYYMAGWYMFYSSTSLTGFIFNPGSGWSASYYSSNAHSGHIDLQNPYLAKTTTFKSKLITADTSAYVADYSGWLNNTTSYTAFTLTAVSGTMTGGEIRVYGYQNS
jgi:hypothetical protein